MWGDFSCRSAGRCALLWKTLLAEPSASMGCGSLHLCFALLPYGSMQHSLLVTHWLYVLQRRYMDRDSTEGEESCAQATGLMQTIYRQVDKTGLHFELCVFACKTLAGVFGDHHPTLL